MQENRNLLRLEAGSFVSLSTRVKLNVSFCAISEIEPGAFSELDSVSHLDLTGNNLVSLALA